MSGPRPPAGPNSLPRELSSFVGRQREVAGISERLSKTPLVTITGGSGMGKTRLALHLAHRLAPNFRDGAWLVELASLAPTDDPSLVAQAVASVLDVRPEPGRSFTDSVVARLRDASILLVLDNAEHVLGATATFAAAVLQDCPQLSVLVTSQTALGTTGEHAWPLAPLSLPGPGQAGTESEAVALFHARAQAVNPNFEITGQSAEAVTEICRRLDGIPLAIELAAARTAVLSPIEIAEHLGERFGLLTRTAPAATPRHQTLQSALDWSWELLSPPEQSLLRRLSVFAGGAGLDGVRAVCTGGEVARDAVLDLLAALVSKSLVVADTSRSRARYRLLETVRAYGSDRLTEAGETGALGELHAHWYLEMAEQGWHQLVAEGDNEGSNTLEAEHDNLRAALAWFLAAADALAALRMGSALTPFWKTRGHFREGRDWLERALALGAGVPTGIRVRGLWGAGLLSLLQGDLDRATSALQASLALARHHGYERPAMEALNLLAFISVFTSDPLTALPMLDESVAWARARGENAFLVTALALYGRALLFSGDTDGAQAVFEECRELGSAFGPGGDSEGLIGLAWVALSQGRHDGAGHLLAEVLPTVRRDGDRFETALVLSFVGELAWRRGDHHEAKTALEEGVGLARAMGAPFPLSRCLLALGRVAAALGDHKAAVDLVDEATEAARRAHFPHAVVRCLVARAGLDRAARDLDEAGARLEEALAIAADNGDRTGMALALRPLGTLARLRGDYQRSASLHLQALEQQVAAGDVGGAADTLNGLAGVAVAQERAEHAARLLGAAHRVRQAHGSVRSPVDGPDHDVDTALVRAALDLAEFERAFGQGSVLSLEEAVALAGRSRGGRKRPVMGWASLTPMERQVVDLVAEGFTNREIGERLFVSPRTVQAHLLRVFPKLGITSRRQLRPLRAGENGPLGKPEGDI